MGPLLPFKKYEVAKVIDWRSQSTLYICGKISKWKNSWEICFYAVLEAGKDEVGYQQPCCLGWPWSSSKMSETCVLGPSRGRLVNSVSDISRRASKGELTLIAAWLPWWGWSPCSPRTSHPASILIVVHQEIRLRQFAERGITQTLFQSNTWRKLVFWPQNTCAQ